MKFLGYKLVVGSRFWKTIGKVLLDLTPLWLFSMVFGLAFGIQGVIAAHTGHHHWTVWGFVLLALVGSPIEAVILFMLSELLRWLKKNPPLHIVRDS